MASQKFMLTNFPISFLWHFLNSRLYSWNNKFLPSKFIIQNNKKKFCRLHVEISIFWSGRYLLKRKWLGFNSLHYLYKSKFGVFYWEQHRHPYIRFPKHTTSEKRLAHTHKIVHTKAIVTTFLGRILNIQLQTPLHFAGEMTYCAIGNSETKQTSEDCTIKRIVFITEIKWYINIPNLLSLTLETLPSLKKRRQTSFSSMHILARLPQNISYK